MRIIPAIDLIDGKCVRLKQGDYNEKTVYSNDPLAMAQQFEQAGIRFLHLVDLDGAKKGSGCNLEVLDQLASKTSLQIDFGGGIRTLDDFKRVFDLGAHQVTAGSVAVTNPRVVEQAAAIFGTDRIILGADYKDGFIATHGWTELGGLSLTDHIQAYLQKGINRVICTDISRDGMLQGASNKRYEELINTYPELCLIASGGVSSIADLSSLERIGCEAVIIGKALYEQAITLSEITTFIKSRPYVN